MHLCIPLLSTLLSKETWLKPPQNTFTLSCHSMFCSRYGFHTDRLTDNLRSGEFGNIPSLFLLMYSQVILYWTRNPPSLFVKELYLIGVLRTTSVTLFLRRTEKLSVMAVRMGHDPMTSAVVADMGFEPIREVLNIHLARLLASRLSTIRQSASDLFQVYSCIQGSILTN